MTSTDVVQQREGLCCYVTVAVIKRSTSMIRLLNVPWRCPAVPPALCTPAAGQRSLCPWTAERRRGGRGPELADGQTLACTVPPSRLSSGTGNWPAQEREGERRHGWIRQKCICEYQEELGETGYMTELFHQSSRNNCCRFAALCGESSTSTVQLWTVSAVRNEYIIRKKQHLKRTTVSSLSTD